MFWLRNEKNNFSVRTLIWRSGSYQYNLTKYISGLPLVPESCCRGDKAICQGHEKFYGPPEKGPPMMKGYLNNEHLYTEGCYDKLVTHLRGHALILGGIGACVPLLLVSL